MIIEVRTRTVEYKARVKNSLSFSTLPTKPFPTPKGADRARREEQTAWEPVPSPEPALRPRDGSVVVTFHLQCLLRVSPVQQ